MIYTRNINIIHQDLFYRVSVLLLSRYILPIVYFKRTIAVKRQCQQPLQVYDILLNFFWTIVMLSRIINLPWRVYLNFILVQLGAYLHIHSLNGLVTYALSRAMSSRKVLSRIFDEHVSPKSVVRLCKTVISPSRYLEVTVSSRRHLTRNKLHTEASIRIASAQDTRARRALFIGY